MQECICSSYHLINRLLYTCAWATTCAVIVLPLSQQESGGGEPRVGEVGGSGDLQRAAKGALSSLKLWAAATSGVMIPFVMHTHTHTHTYPHATPGRLLNRQYV